MMRISPFAVLLVSPRRWRPGTRHLRARRQAQDRSRGGRRRRRPRVASQARRLLLRRRWAHVPPRPRRQAAKSPKRTPAPTGCSSTRKAISCPAMPSLAGCHAPISNGKATILTEKYQGKRYNNPNDLTIDSRGRIYFSDPRYGPRDGMEILERQGPHHRRRLPHRSRQQGDAHHRPGAGSAQWRAGFRGRQISVRRGQQ